MSPYLPLNLDRPDHPAGRGTPAIEMEPNQTSLADSKQYQMFHTFPFSRVSSQRRILPKEIYSTGKG